MMWMPGRAAVMLLAASAMCVVAADGPFLDSPRSAFRQARSLERPLLVGFHTAWCESCERMRQTTWRAPEVLELLEQFVALSVDGDRQRTLVMRYGVSAYPTLVMANPEGAPLLVLRGFQDRRTMREHLERVLARRDELSAWAAAAAARRPDTTALVGLADFALSRGAYDHAERLYRRALQREDRVPEPLSRRARVGLGEVLTRTDRPREAARILRR